MDKMTAQNDRSVKDYISSLDDEQTKKDSQVLIEMMQRISGHEPKLWNVGTIGFDTYHYKYDSGREGDATISGFSQRKHTIASKIKAGDLFICYLTGVMRWVGVLEVISPTNDTSPIWKDADFPVRFAVRPLILLDAEQGIPMHELEGHVDFYEGVQDRGKFKGFVRASPTLFKCQEDGQLIHKLLQKAEKQPILRPVDPKKLSRKPYFLFKADRTKGKTTIPAKVTVPEPEDIEQQEIIPSLSSEDTTTSATQHTEIQYYLLRLGIDMNLDIWVAKNDRSKIWDGHVLGTLPRMVSELPTQLNEATTRTIELIDVLWLKGNSIVAAFEVEYTSSIYSGLLRMSDLLSLQPNLDINLYLVAPDERRNKVQQEILRPTFELREKPLSKVCGFLSFSNLIEKIEGIHKLGIVESVKPDFLAKIAEYFGENGK